MNSKAKANKLAKKVRTYRSNQSSPHKENGGIYVIDKKHTS